MFCASNILLFLVFANCKWSVQFTFANEEEFLDVDIFCTLPTTIKMHININKTWMVQLVYVVHLYRNL